MNEKVKNFFAIIGGFFAAAVALFLAILAGRRNGDSDKNGMAAVKDAQCKIGSELGKIGSDISAARRINKENRDAIAGCKSIIDSVEKRNAKN